MSRKQEKLLRETLICKSTGERRCHYIHGDCECSPERENLMLERRERDRKDNIASIRPPTVLMSRLSEAWGGRR